MGVKEGGTFTLEKAPPGERPLYTLKEAARYLGLSEATLPSWVRGRSCPTRGQPRRGHLAGPRHSPPPIRPPGELLSFNNLVEANVLAALRRMRRALEHAQKLGHERPLLLDPKAGLGGVLEEGASLLALSRGGWLALRQILEEYLSRVEEDHGLSPHEVQEALPFENLEGLPQVA